MVLRLLAPPTAAQTQAALEALPDGFAAMGAVLLGAPGITAHDVLLFADAMDAGARQRRELFPHGDAESAAMSRLAGILRDAAPRYPHPPREPATALSAAEADRRIHRHAIAAGIALAPEG